MENLRILIVVSGSDNNLKLVELDGNITTLADMQNIYENNKALIYGYEYN